MEFFGPADLLNARTANQVGVISTFSLEDGSSCDVSSIPGKINAECGKIYR